MPGFNHSQQINLQQRVPDHARPMQSSGSHFGAVRSLNANDLGRLSLFDFDRLI
jgi:hypothetical protein